MSRSTSNVVWTLLAVIGAILVIAGAYYGPRLYRAGRDLAGPIMDLAASEEAIAALDTEFPFSPPADGLIDEGRLDAFLAVRRDLEPRYRQWQELVDEVEQSAGESLAEAKKVLAATQSVVAAQIDTLRARAMSPAEFRWLEENVYDRWLNQLDRLELSPRLSERLRDTTVDDLAFLDRLEGRHGRSAAITAMRGRLQERAAALERQAPPQLEGVSPANADLLWRHHGEVAALRLDEYASMHSLLSEGTSEGLNVRVGDQDSGRRVVID